VTYRERIRVDGEMIGAGDVAAGLTAIREMVQAWDPHPTFFEITTALALDHFKKHECELIVLETGLGGRLDATNAVTPIVSVITPIGFDHEKWLGHTLEAIALEKAGIIKARVPVVSAPQTPEAEKVIRARAKECESPIELVRSVYLSRPSGAKADDRRWNVALPGNHQTENAALAVAALRVGNVEVSEDAIARGLAEVEWPARFQRWDDRIVIDGAHNPAGAQVLAETWREQFGEERATIILAVLREKNVSGICHAVAPMAARFILPRIRTERALPPDELVPHISDLRLPHSVAPSFTDALESALAHPEPILITGSLHFAGEALASLRGDPDALEDCAQ
jgi:dihydrofolate synthase/folylpolyglutamate synthase